MYQKPSAGKCGLEQLRIPTLFTFHTVNIHLVNYNIKLNGEKVKILIYFPLLFGFDLVKKTQLLESRFFLFRCKSPVGYRGFRNGIGLGVGCWKKGVVMHEMAHSLGVKS